MYYRSRRIPAKMRASVTISGQTVKVDVLDVSESGVKIAFPSQQLTGTRLLFRAARSDLPGVVQWCDGKTAGIKLDRPLSQNEIGEIAGLIWAG